MDLLSLVFPKCCLNCGKAKGYVCEECLEKIERQWLFCLECRKVTPVGMTHDKCRTKYGLNGLISIYKYKGIIKKIIGILKYRFAYDLASTLADLYIRDLGDIKYLGSPILIPVPLSDKRKKWRGFNQSEKIGEIVAKKLNWEFENNLLLRIKHGIPQVGLTHQQRARNISGEFAVNMEKLALLRSKNRQILIVFDDVWTTGATLKETCKVLKEKGFTNVWGMTIAR
jgi:competence protein ComFC